ncbi:MULTISPECIES: monovalent cation/H(+) antiporter subunit G [unclassified Corynebacterium]|uniref:monovalent cation/H(+) antiporter subunit G n=1 Tax=unclassified Corynebacterium TaxID=2624378 RepID=UPI0030B3C65A
MSIGSITLTVLFGLLVLLGSVYLLGAVVAMWRSHDALSRLNQLSAGITVGIPALVLANMVVEFDAGTLSVGKVLTGLLAIVAVLIVATVASEMLGRSVLGARDGSAEDYKPGSRGRRK